MVTPDSARIDAMKIRARERFGLEHERGQPGRRKHLDRADDGDRGDARELQRDELRGLPHGDWDRGHSLPEGGPAKELAQLTAVSDVEEGGNSGNTTPWP